ncbi:MAG: hypothetical protein RQ966_16660 [Acetobacteraceae bacterium]|nr:hypothetical protein [Acetobacteraceae bacterium]
MLNSTAGQLGIFFSSLILSIAASIVMSYRIEQVGNALGVSEGLLGIVTALGADSPEIAAAVTAISRGQHDIGLGVIFGSNIFNFAALLGLSAAMVGSIKMRRKGLVLDASVALWVALMVALQAIGWLSTLIAGLLLAGVVVPYIALFLLKRDQIERVTLLGGISGWLAEAVGGAREDARGDGPPSRPDKMDILSLFPLLVAIVLSSIGMVDTASTLGQRWNIPGAITGTLILAGLTGIPNAVAAVQLARAGRGSAVATETLTSNTINTIVGGFVPLAILGVSQLSFESQLSITWLLGITAIAGILCFVQRGLTRLGGLVLIALYLGFAGVTIMT